MQLLTRGDHEVDAFCCCVLAVLELRGSHLRLFMDAAPAEWLLELSSKAQLEYYSSIYLGSSRQLVSRQRVVSSVCDLLIA